MRVPLAVRWRVFWITAELVRLRLGPQAPEDIARLCELLTELDRIDDELQPTASLPAPPPRPALPPGDGTWTPKRVARKNPLDGERGGDWSRIPGRPLAMGARSKIDPGPSAGVGREHVNGLAPKSAMRQGR